MAGDALKRGQEKVLALPDVISLFLLLLKKYIGIEYFLLSVCKSFFK